MKLKIGTLNLQNDKRNRTNGLIEDGNYTFKLVADHIKHEKFDILGTQELTRKFAKNISDNIEDYKLYGGYRFGTSRIAKSLSIISDYNENNNIITKGKVISKSTKHLPLFPRKQEFKKMFKRGNLMPRILTILIVSFNDLEVCCINTHLDYHLKTVQQKQLDYLLKIIKKYLDKYPVVLTGDFNLEKDNLYFKDFIIRLNNLGLKRVEVNDKTNAEKYRSKTAIDHIFIPIRWTILKQGINKLPNVTDHNEVYVEVETN